MRLALATICFLAAPLAGAATAHAENMSETKARKIGRDYGACVVGERSEIARRYVVNDVPDGEALRWDKGIVVPFCLSNTSVRGSVEAVFPADHYRYVLAQALFKRDLAKLAAPNVANIAALSHRPMPEPIDPADLPADAKKAEQVKTALANRSVAHLADMLAECSVRRDPANAKSLLDAPIGTREENDAFKAFAPAMAHCIPTGKQVRLNRTVTKGSIAVNYYRLSVAAGLLPADLLPKVGEEPEYAGNKPTDALEAAE
jgi:hypothetical protein